MVNRMCNLRLNMDRILKIENQIVPKFLLLDNISKMAFNV